MVPYGVFIIIRHLKTYYLGYPKQKRDPNVDKHPYMYVQIYIYIYIRIDYRRQSEPGLLSVRAPLCSHKR